jgi:enoyl-CoA hydratase
MTAVLTEVIDPGVVLLTFNQPDKLNAMSPEMVDEVVETLAKLGADDQCRVIILTGAGRGFCAGHDLADFPGATGEQWPTVPEQLAGQRTFARLTSSIIATPKPVIAAVNGPAAGGGFAVALASDTRVCSTSARFNAAFIRIGIGGSDVGVSYLLPRIVGPTAAFEMMLTGRLVDAEEAHRIGLVLRVVEDGAVVDAALEIARNIVRNSPFAVEMTKQVMWSNLNAPSLDAAIQLEDRNQILCIQTNDHREAIKAFVEKRPANFTNT